VLFIKPKKVIFITNPIIKNKFVTGLNSNTCNHQILSYDEDSCLQIVANYFNLKPVLVERTRYLYIILKKEQLFHNACYETRILGCMLQAQNEYYRDLRIDRTPDDVTYFIELLFKEPDRKKSLIQVYSILQTLEEIIGRN
jgi:hypothetical protein